MVSSFQGNKKLSLQKKKKKRRKKKNIIKKSRLCHKEDILTPNRHLTREFDLTSPHSCLSNGTYLTNKHYHFKLPRIIVENGLCIKKTGF